MYTAIVFPPRVKSYIKFSADELNLIGLNFNIKCDHLTLAMGDASARYRIGARCEVALTHYGSIEGRVSAFKADIRNIHCDNKTPHVTIAVAMGAKPVESNNITNWIELDEPIFVHGYIEVCN